MKNLSVGRKILFGFLTVVALIVVILVMTVITSVSRNKDLESIEGMSDLQHEANELLDLVNHAQIELRTLFTTSGESADAAYDAAAPFLQSALAQVDTLETYSAGLSDIDMAEANSQLRSSLEGLTAQVDAIHDKNEQLSASGDALYASFGEMALSAGGLMDILADSSAGSGALTIEQIMADIAPAQGISDAVDEIWAASSALVVDRDTSVAPTLEAGLDSIDELLDVIAAGTTSEDVLALVSKIEGELETARAALDGAVSALGELGQVTQEAEALTAQLIGVVDAGVLKISEVSGVIIKETRQASDFVMFLMVIVVVAAAAAAIAMSFFLGRAITRPLGMMQELLQQVGGTGSLRVDPELMAKVEEETKVQDEIGQSMKAFYQMMDRMIFIGDRLTEVADGDLTADIPLLSDDDTMGIALKTMGDNLNSMFSEIQAVSAQVSTASGEIAQGAQSLAQGSTEQASTVEEISASINEITQQASVSVETASTAAQESESIRAIAQEGNDKMDRLAEAVQQMNDASQSIGQVIKVIDDIAFQTNILALNAAVEAARAGQHGKGFAVVADEVRNLAGKSADAAKETASLISASMEKAEYGLSLSQETAATLTEIVSGVEKTTSSLITISDQSNGSRAATEQVNAAVDQVAVVVQQNSATSEESAASSQEMSSQAQVLQQLVARFKLKGGALGGGGAAPRLPEAAAEAYDYGADYGSNDFGGGGDFIF